MKSKIFKIVLPAFALLFAISVSLAFTPAGNSMVEETPVTAAFYQNPDENNCTQVVVDCDTCGCEICTAVIFGIERQLFLKNAGGKCNILLYKP
ncbi:DUF6520 family protein [Mariniflexile rhizosphaerae]|nr:DUF6520 family protein [Mariniflexile sp. TRM1-10]